MLFGNVLDRLKDAQDRDAQGLEMIPVAGKSAEELALEDSSLNTSINFSYAAALVSAGLVVPEVLDKLKKIKPNPTAMRITIAIDMRNVALARSLALDPEFVQENEHFLASGQAVKSALEKGFIDFARELIAAGYSVPKHLLIEAAREENLTLIQHSIDSGLYAADEDLELDFWYLLHQGYLKEAKELVGREPVLQGIVGTADLMDAGEVRRFAGDLILVTKALNGALRRGYDSLASTLFGLCPEALTKEMVPLAVDMCCVEFLRKLWIGDSQLREGVEQKRRKEGNAMWTRLLEREDEESKKALDKMMSLSNILEHALKLEKVEAVTRVLSWPGAVHEPGVLRTLINYGQQDIAKDVLRRSARGASRRNMKLAFDKRQMDVCVAMLNSQDAVLALSDTSVQEALVAMVESGETILQALELLNRIPKKQWHMELTNDLCDNLTIIAKKRTEMVVCYAPLLVCALTAELMDRLSSVSLQHQTQCLGTKEIYMFLGVSIQDNIRDEDELKYLLTQTDSQGRTVLTILSKNQYFQLLENDEIGTIVTKMWNGTKRHYGILGASTLSRSFHSPSGSEEAMQFSKPMDKIRPYMFHFEQWTESCSLRFYGQMASTFTHVVIYQLLIYTAISKDAFMDVAGEPSAVGYLRVSQFWVGCIMAENLLHYLYGWYTGRGFHVDRWEMMEYFMFADMILLMLNLHENYMGPGKAIPDIDPKIFNATLHSIMVLFIWLRFTAVIVTDKTFGPFIRMVYLLITRTFTFFLIFFMFGLCMAAVLNGIFYQYSEQFADFTITIKTEIVAAMGGIDIFAFQEYAGLGAVLLGAWTILSNVIMLNIVVALLTNVYSELTSRVESEHAAVIIRYYDRWYWNDSYGVLVFLPPPLSYISLILSPIVLLAKDKKKWSMGLCRILYVVYAIPQFAYFCLGNVVYFFLLYIKGFMVFAKTGWLKDIRSVREILTLNQGNTAQVEDLDSPRAEENCQGNEAPGKVKTNFSIRKFCAWAIIGGPWLLWAVLRDCWDFWAIMYKNALNITDESERYKMQQIVTEKFVADVQLVLEALAVPEISAQQLVEIWSLVDTANADLSSSERIDLSSSNKRLLALEYFIQYANSRGDSTIDVQRMKKLLPKRMGNVYDQAYMTRAQHVFVPWMTKGIRRYQQKIGTTRVKHHSQTGTNQDHLNGLLQSTEELKAKCEEMVNSMKTMTQFIEEQDAIVKTLGAKVV